MKEGGKNVAAEKAGPEPSQAELLALWRSLDPEERREATIRAYLKKVYERIAAKFETLGAEMPPIIGIPQDGDYYHLEDGDFQDEDDLDEDEDEDDEDDLDEADDADDEAEGLLKALRQYLEAQERSQGWLANKLGVSQGAVSSWFAGRSSPSEKNLAKIQKLVS